MTSNSNPQAQLESLCSGLTSVLQQQLAAMPEARATIASVITRLSLDNSVSSNTAAPNLLNDLLGGFTSNTNDITPEAQNLVDCVLSLADHLPWYQRPIANNPTFMAGHSNAQIIGPEGLVVRHDLIVGVTLMRPNIDYPDHQHDPEEVYLALSEGHWRQEDSPWNTPGIGGLIYNPSNVFHGMKSLNTPLIAMWCLPLDRPFTSFSSPLPSSPPSPPTS